jgi:hypothetical protein
MASLKAHHPDAPPLILHWPLLYANKELVGQGTLLTVSEREWQVVGTMPVKMGMGLKMWISPGHRDRLCTWGRRESFGQERTSLGLSCATWMSRTSNGLSVFL